MDKAVIKKACAKSYATFCHVMQGDDWFDPKHKELCDHIQQEIEAAYNDADCKNSTATVRLLVVLARGSLKSTIVSKYLQVWLCLPCEDLPWKSENLRTLLAMNTHPNAREKMRGIRGIFDSNETFKALWPELLPTKNSKWSDEAACINRTQEFEEATFEGCGTKTRVTSRHFNCIIEDDTTAPEEKGQTDSDILAPSVEEIDRAVGWHKRATALLVPKGVRIRVVVTTRWGDYDLVSYIKEHENYAPYDMPAWEPVDGWSQKDSERVGAPNMSIFYNVEQLKEIEIDVGPYMFQTLYLNNPIDASKRTFQNDWIHYVEAKDVPDDKGYFAIAIDPAISNAQGSCETAITRVKHVIEDGRPTQYWMDAIHGHFNPLETATKCLDLVAEAQEETKYIIVEDIAYQAALKHILWDEMERRGVSTKIMPLKGSKVRGAKDARIEGMQPLFANRRVFLVKGLSKQVESQLKQFPHGKLVDIIDSFSMHRKLYKKLKIERPKAAKPKHNPDTIENVKAGIRKRHRASSKFSLLRPRRYDYTRLRH